MSTSPTFTLAPATLIDERYEIVEPLGSGGMGWVFRARDITLNGEFVALKFLYPHLFHEPAAFTRFKNEVYVARRLIHPNVVRTYNIGLSRSQAYLSMEYVCGVTLRQTIEEDSAHRLSEDRAIGCFLEICAAVRHAHAMGVIHRDLKSENVMIERGGAVKVSDFGLSATLRSETQLTRTGQLLGTPYYMAPEQFLGQAATARSDIYALGILFYEMLCGAPPFREASLYALAEAHSSQSLPALPSPVDASLWAILERSTAKRAEERFESVEALMMQLGTLTGRCPVLEPTRAPALIPVGPGVDPEAAVRPRRHLKLGWPSRVVLSLLLGVLWIRHNQSAQMYAAAALFRFEILTAHTVPGVRSLLRIPWKGPGSPLLEDLRIRKGGVWARLWAGDDPNDIKSCIIFYETQLKMDRYACPVAYAVGMPASNELEVLLDYGANPNGHPSFEQPPILSAVRFGNLAAIKLLLEHGADPNAVDELGWTALYVAIRHADTLRGREILQFLLEHGADPLRQRTSEDNPLRTAVVSANAELIAMLLRYIPTERLPDEQELLRYTAPEHAGLVRTLLARRLAELPSSS